MAAADDDNDTDHAHVHLRSWPACSRHVYAFICRLVTGNPCYIGVGRESLSCVLSHSICNVRHRRETYRVAFHSRVQAKYDTFIEKHTHTHTSVVPVDQTQFTLLSPGRATPGYVSTVSIYGTLSITFNAVDVINNRSHAASAENTGDNDAVLCATRSRPLADAHAL